MSVPDAISAIKDCQIFHNLTDEQVELLADLGKFCSFANGHFLLCCGQAAECMHIVLEGEVGLELLDEVEEPLRVDTLSEGDILGWSWLDERGQWQFDALALGSVRTLAFDAARLRRLCEDDVHFGRALMADLAKVFADRLTQTRMRLVENML
jgi:CRP/FNR family cyclic AMP-dependent transcriptional regulator